MLACCMKLPIGLIVEPMHNVLCTKMYGTCYMYDLICGWCDVLFFTKFYLKSIRCVIPIYIVRDDYELVKFLISLCRKEYHGLVGFLA